MKGMGFSQADNILYGSERLPDTKAQAAARPEAQRMQSQSAITFTDTEYMDLKLKDVSETLARLAPGHGCDTAELNRLIADAEVIMDLPELVLDPEKLVDDDLFDKEYDRMIEHWNQHNISWEQPLLEALPDKLAEALPEDVSPEDCADWLAHRLFERAQDRQALAVYVLPQAAEIRRELVALGGLDWVAAHDLINAVVLAACEVKIRPCRLSDPNQTEEQLEQQQAARIAALIARARERKFLKDLSEAEQQRLKALVIELFNGIYLSESQYIEASIENMPVGQEAADPKLALEKDRLEERADRQGKINEIIQTVLAERISRECPQVSTEKLSRMVNDLQSAADEDIFYEYLEEQHSDPCSMIRS